jgi:phage terminase small subunit
LNDRAKKVWAETAAILISRNVYGDDCEHMLATFCILYARFLAAEDMLQGLPLDSDEARRYLRISNQSCNLAFRVATDLGLTVVGRQRVPKKAGRPAFLTAARDAQS